MTQVMHPLNPEESFMYLQGLEFSFALFFAIKNTQLSCFHLDCLSERLILGKVAMATSQRSY